jgi:hypothetical protein
MSNILFEALPKLTPGYIESQVSQEQVMAHYLNITLSDVTNCIGTNHLICNPLRSDNNPTAGFYVTGKGKLRFNDFAGFFHGDMYDLVGHRTLLDPNDSREFMIICNIIARDFRLHKYADSTYKTEINTVKLKPKSYSVLNVQTRDWRREDIKYWRRFHISDETLSLYWVEPAQYVWWNDRLIYAYTRNDPAYAYFHGMKENIEQWQIYFPFRKRSDKNPRFITNTTRLRGLQNVQNSITGCLTKSLKDVMTLHELGINAAGVAAESIHPTINEIEYLKGKWESPYSLMDFDYTGVKLAIRLREKGFEPLFFTTGKMNSYNYGAKDISEAVENYGFDKIKAFVQSLQDYGSTTNLQHLQHLLQ